MPDMNGFEACKIIKQNSKINKIPILFLTAKTKEEDIQRGFELGAVDYIPKPFNSIELLIRVKNQLELSLYRQELENRIKIEIEKTNNAQKLMLHKHRLADMGTLLNMIAHQWRKPLGAIRSIMIAIDFTIQSGKYNLSNKDDINKLLEYINQKNNKVNENIDFLSDTIENFSNFYKKDKDKELVNITCPLLEILDIIQFSLNHNNIEIITDFQTNNKISLYKNEFMQVILSIIKNSEDNFLSNHMENPVITISTQTKKIKW
jgi:signal transduction histidine kinase